MKNSTDKTPQESMRDSTGNISGGDPDLGFDRRRRTASTNVGRYLRGGSVAVLTAIVGSLHGTSTVRASEITPRISAASLLARTKVLASDEFEGRAPGSPGEEKTVNYLVAEFKKLGLQPGNPDGTYIQDAALVGITSKPSLTFDIGGKAMPMEHINDYVGFSSRVTPHVEGKESDVVFVGYGVVAPEFGWDDFKDVDVRGKTVVMLINDPPVADQKTGQLDPKMFGETR
jgi:hypothetical protein